MTVEAIRRCDAPACRAEIADTAKRYEFHCGIVVINGERIEHRNTSETCSPACLLAVAHALIREATEGAGVVFHGTRGDGA